jgi:hypothetical protein
MCLSLLLFSVLYASLERLPSPRWASIHAHCPHLLAIQQPCLLTFMVLLCAWVQVAFALAGAVQKAAAALAAAAREADWQPTSSRPSR